MAIAATGPAGSNSFNPVVSNSFSPPAGSLLVAVLPAGGGTPTVSNSGTARTWTQRVARTGFCSIYTAPNPTALSGITVTASGVSGGIRVFYVTGQHPSSPIGATADGSSAVNNIDVGYTSTGGGSRGFCAAADGNSLGVPSSTDDEYAFNGSGRAGLAIVKAANTATAGESVTFNLDAAAGTPSWNWVALEILPASLDATISVTTVTGAAAVPAPTIQAGATARPAAVAGAAEVPAPSVHAGATARPAVVGGQADVPTPNVVAGSAELIEPAVVEGQADVPAPSITAEQHRTISPAVVGGQADVPAPTVTATFAATITPDVVEAQALVPSPGVSVPVLPGHLITEDTQVEWGTTVLWGPGTSYTVREITGWDAKPQVDSLTVEEPNRHGAFAGPSYLQRRIVTVRLQVQAHTDPSQVTPLLAQLRHDTRTLRDNTLLTLVIRGKTETLLTNAKVIDRTGVWDRDWAEGHPEPVITFECPDPRRYGLDQHSVIVPANAPSATPLVNAGDLYTPPLLRFYGPVTNPMLVNETLDRILAFDIVLTGGQTLIVDTQRGEALIGDVDHENDMADTISVPLKEFFLEVDTNLLSYETDAGGTAGCEVLWRDAAE
ncbi:hypothetical protein ACIBH1_05430 [Nonomuraea sp. NPDC050663]|uniref:hypothetical protein n=1 Tax=Nonomuraea sp. NPDC050663 TaxID=3364370 RepID=UPI00378A56BB